MSHHHHRRHRRQFYVIETLKQYSGCYIKLFFQAVQRPTWRILSPGMPFITLTVTTTRPWWLTHLAPVESRALRKPGVDPLTTRSARALCADWTLWPPWMSPPLTSDSPCVSMSLTIRGNATELYCLLQVKTNTFLNLSHLLLLKSSRWNMFYLSV